MIEQQDLLGGHRHDGRELAGGAAQRVQLTAKVVPVASYDAGIRGCSIAAPTSFFADRAILLDAAQRSASVGDLIVLDRRFTYEPLALGARARRRGFSPARGPNPEPAVSIEGVPPCTRDGSERPDESALAFFRLGRASAIALAFTTESHEEPSDAEIRSAQ